MNTDLSFISALISAIVRLDRSRDRLATGFVKYQIIGKVQSEMNAAVSRMLMCT